MRFYTTLKLGPNREKTWDGFTVFRNVSVSRVGEQVYGPDEGIGVAPGPDGLIRIMRKPEEVFRQETLDSGNCKSLVIDHPDNEDESIPDVRPENWRELTHGVMVNLRRGTGDQSEESVADIFIGSDEVLREIDLGLRELSLGYADGGVGFTITAGGTAFVAGDGFSVTVSYNTIPVPNAYFNGPGDSATGAIEIAFNL